jgi:hypothetical protein
LATEETGRENGWALAEGIADEKRELFVLGVLSVAWGYPVNCEKLLGNENR